VLTHDSSPLMSLFQRIPANISINLKLILPETRVAKLHVCIDLYSILICICFYAIVFKSYANCKKGSRPTGMKTEINIK